MARSRERRWPPGICASQLQSLQRQRTIREEKGLPDRVRIRAGKFQPGVGAACGLNAERFALNSYWRNGKRSSAMNNYRFLISGSADGSFEARKPLSLITAEANPIRRRPACESDRGWELRDNLRRSIS